MAKSPLNRLAAKRWLKESNGLLLGIADGLARAQEQLVRERRARHTSNDAGRAVLSRKPPSPAKKRPT